MLERTDFVKKQIVFVFACRGDKISFSNDNLVIKDKDGVMKYQVTCYLIFMVFIVGDTSLTTGIIRRTKKFGFTICLMTQSFKIYSIIGNRMEGNTLLHHRQYAYSQNDIARFLVYNKILNQREAINRIRNKTPAYKDGIQMLDGYIEKLRAEEMEDSSLLGIEGSAARIYFPLMFSNVKWRGRKPRIKSDFVNATLDIGYNLLFNLIDSLLQVYGFDVYCGVYHKEFYMRKSLSCDLMEPMRPIIDLQVRKAINLSQCKEEDFRVYQGQYSLEYKKSASYVRFFLDELLEYKEDIFIYIQQYYRCFMKGKDASAYSLFFIK